MKNEFEENLWKMSDVGGMVGFVDVDDDGVEELVVVDSSEGHPYRFSDTIVVASSGQLAASVGTNRQHAANSTRNNNEKRYF